MCYCTNIRIYLINSIINIYDRHLVIPKRILKLSFYCLLYIYRLDLYLKDLML